MITVSEITVKMIAYSQRNLHDICHFLKVFAYAKTIGKQEHLEQRQQKTLEIAALLHDIACPLCREKYGSTNGKHQELEGAVLAKEFLQGTGLPEELIDRVVFLVSHHHTYTAIDDRDYQILLEADYLVNADESNYPEASLRSALKELFKTETGKGLLQSIYRLR